MAKQISRLAVVLGATVNPFVAGMRTGSVATDGLAASLGRLTDTVATNKAMMASVGEVKIAGRETISSLSNVLMAARYKLQDFTKNHDVQVAAEIGREKLSESWFAVRKWLANAAERAGVNVALGVAKGKTADLKGWVTSQRNRLQKLAQPIEFRVWMARRAVDAGVANVKSRLEALKKYRVVRIGIAAVDAARPVINTAMLAFGPLRKLATTGIVVGIRATHHGLALGVNKARAVLGGLQGMGRSVASGLSSSFAIIGTAAAALGAYGLGTFIKSSMDSIDTTNDQARALGMSTQKLSELGYAAKLSATDQETLVGGLTKMDNALSDAVTKGGAAGDSFRTLGLDVSELSKLTPDERFKRIATAMQGVENPAQRTSLAMDIFGKSGAKLIPMLLEGEAGLNALSAEARKVGAAFSDVDAAKINAANDSIDRVKATIGGVGNTLAIALAPYITTAADKFVELASSGEGMGSRVTGAVERVVQGVAYATDYVSLLKAGFKLLQAVATAGIYGIVKAVDVLGNATVGALNWLDGGNRKWTTFTGQLADGLLDEAAKLKAEAGQAFGAFMDGASSKAVSQYFAEVRAASQKAAEQLAADGAKIGGAIREVEDEAKGAKKLSDALDDLSDNVASFGLGDVDKELLKLRGLGLGDGQIGAVRDLLDVKSQLEELGKIDTGDPTTDLAAKMEQLQKLYAAGKVTALQFVSIRDDAQKSLADKLGDQAKGVIESVKTPIEKYNAELRKLQALLDGKFITLETFERSKQKALADLAEQTRGKADELSMVIAGSAESQRMRYAARFNAQVEQRKADQRAADARRGVIAPQDVPQGAGVVAVAVAGVPEAVGTEPQVQGMPSGATRDMRDAAELVVLNKRLVDMALRGNGYLSDIATNTKAATTGGVQIALVNSI